jgi:L-serine deaminase
VASGEDVVTETTKKYTGAKEEGQTELRKRLNIIQGILDEGSYQGQELTGKQRNSLLDYIKRINEYLVPVTQGAAHGGSVDKALTGRSRDI